MSAALTRRAALSGAVASVALVGAATAATVPPVGRQVPSGALLALIARVDRARRALEHHATAICEPAEDRHKAAVAAASASVPHITVDAGESAMGGRIIWSSERPQMAHTVIGMADEGREWERKYLAAARRIVANDLLRKRAISRADRQHDYGDLIDANNALCDALSAAMDDVASYPAATPIDLHAKLAWMVEHRMGDGVDWLPELLADAARLAKMEARA